MILAMHWWSSYCCIARISNIWCYHSIMTSSTRCFWKCELPSLMNKILYLSIGQILHIHSYCSTIVKIIVMQECANHDGDCVWVLIPAVCVGKFHFVFSWKAGTVIHMGYEPLGVPFLLTGLIFFYLAT